MLELILKLYSMAMATGVRSPLPHLVGPPGCGKSTVVQQAADTIKCTLHTVNVSRISPLELEGVQMPITMDEKQGMVLHALTATWWTKLRDGDIVLLDEFLRGFPEVYNGLLDILTSRKVGSFELPKVFIIAASNSTITYDKALEDRLLHLPVEDPRKNKRAKNVLIKLIIDQLGLLPAMATSMEMHSVLDQEVLPMFEMLDSFKNRTASPASLKGTSIRNLIGQAQLRQVQSAALAELLARNNSLAIQQGKPQYVFLTSGREATAFARYEEEARALQGNKKLTAVQSINLDLNLQLIDLEKVRNEKGIPADDTDPDDGLDDLFD
jgi:AAA domain (dynein-related subfamily)